MTGSIRGKVAIVTGAGSGLGRASAITLARLGASVLVVDIDQNAAHRTSDEIGSGAVPCVADVALEAREAVLRSVVAGASSVHPRD